MEIDYIKCYGDLQQELDDAKHTLVALNDNIRRIIGRNPKDVRMEKHKIAHENPLKRNDNGERHGPKVVDSSKFKRRSHDTKSSVFNRLSAPVRSHSPEEEPRPRLNSRVIRELPTRQEIVEAQGIDSESRARNRRMFGSLMGTLHKFCLEESRLKQKEDKKAQIEKKLEEQELQERETMKRERELLFLDRKRKQMEIKRIELKMNRLKDFEIWASSMQQLRYHIKTKTKPNIYYKPRIMCRKMDKLLAESQNCLDNAIEKKRDSLNVELSELERSLRGFECDSEEHHNTSIEEPNKSIDTDNNKDESMNHSNNSVEQGQVDARKGDFDSKENKSRNLIEPTLSSSVVVVNKSQKDYPNME